MYKGLILGGLAFGAAFGLERVIAGLGADMKRYDKLRAMSGQGPFLKELLSMAGSAIGDVYFMGAVGSIAGTFLAGSSESAELIDRMDATVEASYETGNNFLINAVTLLCEERTVLVTYRPNAFVSGSLNSSPVS